ncbi:MAG: sensor histidine kinase [Desulfitobacteriaceae bacterium]
MENWFIITKLAVLVYCALRYAGGVSVVVLLLLLYVSLNIAVYIAKEKKWHRILLAASLLLLIVCAQYLNFLFILLIPVNLYEFVLTYRQDLRLAAVLTVLPPLIISHELILEYLLVSLLSYVIYDQASSMAQRLNLLTTENDEMRNRIDRLRGRLHKDEEYERQLKYSSQLEERNKLAQEIHDRVGHAISGSLIQLEAAKFLLASDLTNNKEQGLTILGNVIGVLRKGMESIRETLRNIKPSVEQLGINRVKLLLDEFSASHPVKTTLMHSGNLERISHTQWKVIYDNIYEALTNALKYSQATTIAVKLDVLNTLVKGEVRDNGIGVHTLKKGLGLVGMEERTQSSGGKVIIDGTNGFSVITLLPLEDENHGH